MKHEETKSAAWWQEIKGILSSVSLNRLRKTSKNKRRSRSCPGGKKSAVEDEIVAPVKLNESGHQVYDAKTDDANRKEELVTTDDKKILDETEADQKEKENMAADKLGDLSHAAAKHKMAVRPNNRRTPSRLAGPNSPPTSTKIKETVLEEPNEETIEEIDNLTKETGIPRSASLTSLDLVKNNIVVEAATTTTNLTSGPIGKSQSFRALPAVFLLPGVEPETGSGDHVVDRKSTVDNNNKMLGPNIIMVRTFPKASAAQKEKFELSIANWCLANEGLRRSIQSLQPPSSGFNSHPPISLCLSSESLVSICSGLREAIDDGDTKKGEDVIELNNDGLDDTVEEEKKVVKLLVDEGVPDSLEDESNPDESNDDNAEEDDHDALMNVNVRERRQCLMQMISNELLKNHKVKNKNETLKRLKVSSIVKMAVQNLDNQTQPPPTLTAKKETPETTDNDRAIQDIAQADQEAQDRLETASILAIEAASKVKLMVSKFDVKTTA